MTETKAVMIDIETLGVRNTSIITSIGAVIFDPKSNFINTTYSFFDWIDPLSCEQFGLTMDVGTVTFWFDLIAGNKKTVPVAGASSHITAVFAEFLSWWNVNGLTPKTPVWCHGPSFDIVILENAFRVTRTPLPWSYNSPRDTRTIFDLADFDFKNEPREGTFHNALDDAIHQVKCVQKSWEKLMTEHAN
jgi:hypothetical protein